MFVMWLLLTLMLAALMYFVRRSTRSGKRKHRDRTPPTYEKSTLLEIVPRSAWLPAREINWISTDEFVTLLATHSDLIVIDLRADAQLDPFPFPTALVLSVPSNELANVLEWLPARRKVALCGASDLNIFMITTSPCQEGSVPLYVLEGDLHRAELTGDWHDRRFEDA